MNANLGAKFGFMPRGSQQLVILFGLVALIGFVSTIAFAYVGKPIVVPAVIAGVASAVAIAGWFLCRRNPDLGASTPTTLADTRTGRTITTDTRVLSNPKKLRLLVEAVDTLLGRRPLPTPDGLVRPDGSLDVSRTAEAAEIVNKINQQTQRSTNEAIDALGAALGGPALTQPVAVSGPGTVAAGANVASSSG